MEHTSDDLEATLEAAGIFIPPNVTLIQLHQMVDKAIGAVSGDNNRPIVDDVVSECDNDDQEQQNEINQLEKRKRVLELRR